MRIFGTYYFLFYSVQIFRDTLHVSLRPNSLKFPPCIIHGRKKELYSVGQKIDNSINFSYKRDKYNMPK